MCKRVAHALDIYRRCNCLTNWLQSVYLPATILYIISRTLSDSTLKRKVLLRKPTTLYQASSRLCRGLRFVHRHGKPGLTCLQPHQFSLGTKPNLNLCVPDINQLLKRVSLWTYWCHGAGHHRGLWMLLICSTRLGIHLISRSVCT